MDINADLLHWFINFSIKKPFGSGIFKIPNKKLSEELLKPIIRNFNKRKVHSPFVDNIWGADLADMQLINKLRLIKGIRFLLCVIDLITNKLGLFL